MPQPTLPSVDIEDDDLWRAKRKADRAGLEVPKPKPPQRAASNDSSIYPGRKLSVRAWGEADLQLLLLRLNRMTHLTTTPLDWIMINLSSRAGMGMMIMEGESSSLAVP